MDWSVNLQSLILKVFVFRLSAETYSNKHSVIVNTVQANKVTTLNTTPRLTLVPSVCNQQRLQTKLERQLD